MLSAKQPEIHKVRLLPLLVVRGLGVGVGLGLGLGLGIGIGLGLVLVLVLGSGLGLGLTWLVARRERSLASTVTAHSSRYASMRCVISRLCTRLR